MRLSEFAGYGDRMEQLMRSVNAGRIVHALLFVGPRGSGKRTMARLFAQAMFCSGRDRPCGVCPACKRFLNGSHPDVRVVQVSSDKRSISVDEVRDLIDWLALRPYEGGRHIVIIEQADRMTPAAQNALLKTLETPPGDAMFFLITDAPSALLPTVHSRCQTVRFGDLSVEECAKILEQRGIAPPRAAQLAGLAQGSVGRALDIGADEAFPGLREKVLDSLEAVRDPGSVAAAAAMLDGDRETQDAALDIMELWARDLMAVQSGATPYESQDLERLRRAKLDGETLLKGVVGVRMQLASNVSWQSAIENMYFRLIQPTSIGRTGLSWRQ